MTSESGGWTPGHVLDGRYKIIELLTTTSRCEIYKAGELHALHRPVAVKRLKPNLVSDHEARERFKREALVLWQIRHRCVLSIYDADKIEDNDPYFVTEFADRGSLRDYLEAKPNRKLQPIEALEIANSVCQGLEEAHRLAIIHRDIKPENILLLPQPDGSLLAKLADFSIARVPKTWASENLTQIGLSMGTWPYEPPEQVCGEIADASSDLYSWAIVFFEMLTGEAPKESLKNPATWLPRFDDFPLEFFTAKGVPPEFVPVLQKALHRDRELRCQSASEVIEALQSIKSHAIADVDRCLSAGKEHIKAQEWQAASVEFERGLALCERHGESKELRGKVSELTNELRMGQQFAQGMMRLTERRWQEAIDALEQLQAPSYLGFDVVAYLRKARSEQQYERKYQRILELLKQENWADVIRLSRELSTSYPDRPDRESIGDIRKSALQAQGRKLLEEGELEDAYRYLHSLYDLDPGDRDVAELCATVAFRNSRREDVLASWKHRVEWLEKVIEIDPNHREGCTQQQLDEARHQWAKELQEQNDKLAAVAQLERISLDYSQWGEVQSTLVEIYIALGQYEYESHHWQDAIEWWQKALVMSPNLKGRLRGRIREARIRAWLDDHGTEIVAIGVLFTILTCIVTVWQPSRGGWLGFATATPTPTTSVTSTLTSTITITPSPTFTAMPSGTPTPSPTSTLSPTYTFTPTSTATPTATATSTRTPTRIRLTMTPIRTLTSTPTEKPPKEQPVVPTEPPPPKNGPTGPPPPKS